MPYIGAWDSYSIAVMGIFMLICRSHGPTRAKSVRQTAQQLYEHASEFYVTS